MDKFSAYGHKYFNDSYDESESELAESSGHDGWDIKEIKKSKIDEIYGDKDNKSIVRNLKLLKCNKAADVNLMYDISRNHSLSAHFLSDVSYKINAMAAKGMSVADQINETHKLYANRTNVPKDEQFTSYMGVPIPNFQDNKTVHYGGSYHSQPKDDEFVDKDSLALYSNILKNRDPKLKIKAEHFKDKITGKFDKDRYTSLIIELRLKIKLLQEQFSDYSAASEKYTVDKKMPLEELQRTYISVKEQLDSENWEKMFKLIITIILELINFGLVRMGVTRFSIEGFSKKINCGRLIEELKPSIYSFYTNSSSIINVTQSPLLSFLIILGDHLLPYGVVRGLKKSKEESEKEAILDEEINTDL